MTSDTALRDPAFEAALQSPSLRRGACEGRLQERDAIWRAAEATVVDCGRFGWLSGIVLVEIYPDEDPRRPPAIRVLG